VLDDVTAGLLDLRVRATKMATGAYALAGREALVDEARPLLGKPTPCVGREVELGMIMSTLAGCRDEPCSRGLLITGAPGAGKSRLRHEFLRRVQTQGDDALTLMNARAERLHTGRAYPLIGQAIWGAVAMNETDNLEMRRPALRPYTAVHCTPGDFAATAAFLGELCGTPFPDEESPLLRAARQDPRTMGTQVRQALLHFLRTACAQKTVVLILDDLHRADVFTLDLVGNALPALSDQPFMVLAFGRPEVTAMLPPQLSSLLHQIPLRPLSRKAGEKLVLHVLGKDTPAEVVSRIVDQSWGNALYLEELIRSAAEGATQDVPQTVLAMLQNRIGKLEASPRRVLQAASIFGSEFFRNGVRAVLGASWLAEDVEHCLAQIVESEIVELVPDEMAASHHKYRFRHALVRDAAYSLLTDEDRQLGHRLAGQYLEKHRDTYRSTVITNEHDKKSSQTEAMSDEIIA